MVVINFAVVEGAVKIGALKRNKRKVTSWTCGDSFLRKILSFGENVYVFVVEIYVATELERLGEEIGWLRRKKLERLGDGICFADKERLERGWAKKSVLVRRRRRRKWPFINPQTRFR